MRTQLISLAIAILAVFPLAANAQGFNNININLNDVMVGQRMQAMSQRLNDIDSSTVFSAKKHQKHAKKNKNHRMAHLQAANDQNPIDDQTAPATNSIN